MKTLTIKACNSHVSVSFEFYAKERRLLTLENNLFKELKKDMYRNTYLDIVNDNNIIIYVKSIFKFQKLSSWIIEEISKNW